MLRRWPGWRWSAVIGMLIGVGTALIAQGLGPGRHENPSAVTSSLTQAPAVDRQELLQAVEGWLKAGNVQPPDLPKAVRKVTPLPNGHYLVEMEMQLGVGWFEVWKAGGSWQVKGAPPPGR